MPIAEFNFGTLKHPFGDPRIADFETAIGRVNALAQRSPGFVWMLDDAGMDAVQRDPQGPLSDRPNTASTLSVWTDADSLWRFVHRTLHSRFLARGAEWYVPDDRSHLVIWDIADGHRPTVAEGMAHWRDLQRRGETDTVFGARGLLDRISQ